MAFSQPPGNKLPHTIHHQKIGQYRVLLNPAYSLYGPSAAHTVELPGEIPSFVDVKAGSLDQTFWITPLKASCGIKGVSLALCPVLPEFFFSLPQIVKRHSLCRGETAEEAWPPRGWGVVVRFCPPFLYAGQSRP